MEHLEHKKEKRNERAAIQLGLFLVGLLLFGTAAGGQLTGEEKNGKEKAAIQTSGGVSDAVEPKKIALTFDDGPHPVYTKILLDGLAFFVSTSFSKSFSLYGERVGALSVLCQSKEEADRVLSQLKIAIRTNYSNPPIHGGAVVAAVLNTPELRALWEKELGEMRVRIKAMRSKLVDGLKAAGVKQDMSFMTEQIGMFSYSGLSKEQMLRLRSEFGVYGTDTGRICVAALNSKNIDYVCQAIAKVI